MWEGEAGAARGRVWPPHCLWWRARAVTSGPEPGCAEQGLSTAWMRPAGALTRTARLPPPRLHLAPRGAPRSRPSWGEPCRSRRPELQGGQSPLAPGSWESRPLQTRPPLPETWAPRLLLATCVHVLTTLHAPLSVPLLHPCGFRPGVHVSVCPCPCACGSWRCRGVHAGTEPAVGRQRPDRLTPGPSPRSLAQVCPGAARRSVGFGADADFWEGAGPPQSS